MKRIFSLLVVCCYFVSGAEKNARMAIGVEKSVHVVKKAGGENAPTLLLMGGIQGDEPGGFNATDVFLMHYKILSGNVWVVPVLNRYAMLLNHRGIYGDLNRKFAYLNPKDPEYPLIQSIKGLVVDPQVQVIMHLHDGSGFYRPTYKSALLNPRRWGNSSIIDQDELPGVEFGHLKRLSLGITDHVNQFLLKPIHKYHVRNTHTARGDKEMEKALTYFAIKHKKAAFANEASKELSLAQRVYYHLLAIEGLMQEVGITYTKDFTLKPASIYRLINDPNLTLTMNQNILLPLYGLRSQLKFFPFPKDTPINQISLQSQSYILGLLPRKNQIWLKYGNKLMTRLHPLYLDFDRSLKDIDIEVDGKITSAAPASILEVKRSFKILPKEGYRVNVIGFSLKNGGKKPNEVGVKIAYKNLDQRYSIDKGGKIYRIEIYKGDAFSGMVLVRFI
ncbi:M99 family carboxypeptidase catalytic domain-containing protein [Helicobacter bizzozeronii]|uniref:M99 family carboxypeptidase catalytic domain-containing protein n=1 Tax=Helicobacter bizzozeronii TaxID=56877 RepID=UPI000CF1A72E|nr:M99 family carboxypeptidase catalytic domain-containing protein [Helicobacter bizzozeronii]